MELENAVDEAVDQVNGDIAKNLADIVEISEDIGQQERRISSLEEDMEEQKNVFHTVNWGVSKNRVDIGDISRDMALQRNRTSSLAEDYVKVTQDLAANGIQTSSMAEDIKEISEDVAQQANKTSSLAKKVTAQGKALDVVNLGVSRNKADIEEIYAGVAEQDIVIREISEDLAQQKERTSSLAEEVIKVDKGMTEQRKAFDLVNLAMSEDRADIEGMAQQGNEISSLARTLAGKLHLMDKNIAAQDGVNDRHFGRLEQNLTTQTMAIDRVEEEVARNEEDIEELERKTLSEQEVQNRLIQKLTKKIQEQDAIMAQQKEEFETEIARQKQIINEGMKVMGTMLNQTLLALQPDPVDCLVTSWTWSSCSRTCGGGTMSRARTVTQEPMYGGRSCLVLEEEKACNTEVCLGKALGET